MEQSIELVNFAEELGYSRYWIVEHHAVHYEVTAAPEILVSAILHNTRKIKVGIGGIMLNYHNPYKMAEVVKTLHLLFPQRFEIGVGRGSSGVLADFALNNMRINRIDNADYDQVLQEFLHWLGNDFPAQHEFSQIPIMRDVNSTPDIWLLAATKQSAEKAGNLGLNLAWGAFINPADTVDGFAAYRRQFVPGIYRVSSAIPHNILAVRVIVAQTQQQAERLAMPVRWLFKQRREHHIMPQHMLTVDQAIQQAKGVFPAEQQPWPMYVIGDQQQVYARLSEMLEDTQAEEIMIQDVLPDIAQRKYTYQTLATLFHLESR